MIRTVEALPEFADIAAKVAALAEILPGDDNPFRKTLRQLRGVMSGPNANLTTATAEVNRAVYYLVGRGQVIDEPETWIFLACLTLLELEKSRLSGGLKAAPPGALTS
jgi:hypothetical protein